MVYRVGIIAALAALSLFNAAAAAESKPIPAADFVRGPEYQHPRISPDGKHLAMHVVLRKDDRDVHVITIYDLASLKPLNSIGLPVGKKPANIHWVSNSRLLIENGIDRGWRDSPFSTGEILATNMDGTKQEYLYGYQIGALGRLQNAGRNERGLGYVDGLPEIRNGKFFLRERTATSAGDIKLPGRRTVTSAGNTSSRTFLYEVDATNAERKLIAEVDLANARFVSQRDNTPRFAYRTVSEDELIVKRRDPQAATWDELAHAGSGRYFLPLAITADDKHVIAAVSQSGEPRALVRESLADASRQVLAADATGDIALLQWGPRRDLPFAVSTQIGVPRLKYLDDENAEAKLHKLLAGKFSGQYLEFDGFSEDRTKLILRVRSDRNPGDFYLMDRNTGKAEHLFSERPALDPDRMAERRPIEFKARNGTTLFGFLTLPPGRGEKRLPMILLPHGGPVNSSDRWFFDSDAQFLASRGYAVLQVNYRGSSGRGTSFRDSGYAQFASGIPDDLVDGVRWAVAQGTADPDRICVVGTGFGGYLAMLLPMREQGLFKCAVSVAGIYDLPPLVSEESDVTFIDRSVLMRKAFGTNAAELERASPLRLPEKVNFPLFLVQGTIVQGDRDESQLRAQADAMHAALTKAGKPHEWLRAASDDLVWHGEKDRIVFYEKLEAFLAQHIGK